MTRPNVLLILSDQQRKDSLGCYGHPHVDTPNLDRLAANGVRFDRAYVANPICMPNRTSIFTGKHPSNHGLWTNGLLIDEQYTLGTHLTANGYATAYFGKAHFQPNGGPSHPESRDAWESGDYTTNWTGPYWGFEHVELTAGHSSERMRHYGAWYQEKAGDSSDREIEWFEGSNMVGKLNTPSDLHDSAFVGERVSDFITDQSDTEPPFFCVASFPDPHHAFLIPSDKEDDFSNRQTRAPIGGPEDLESRPIHYQQMYEGAWSRGGVGESKTPNGQDAKTTRDRIAATDVMVELIDTNIGRILQALEESGQADNTIVVFTADHGELLGDHGLWLKGSFFYEGLVNIPLIISAPGRLKNETTQALFSHVDLVPTLCELAGIDAPDFIDGKSQAPVLSDSTTSVRKQCMIEYRTGYDDDDVASKVLITQDLKYARYQNDREELTDLKNDLEERRNIAIDYDHRDDLVEMRLNLLDEILNTEQKGPKQLSHA